MLLEVRNLEVLYGKIPAVRDVSFDVDLGEIVCFVGPNGAGKSTTMLAIAGAIPFRSGEIRFDGKSIGGLAPEDIAERGISLVPEGRHIFGQLTVRENLSVAGGLRRGRAKKTDLVDQLLSYFPILKERYDGYAGSLSGGEQQQLAIARALMTEPRLMIVDEPSLGLAPRFVELVMSIFSKLRSEGQTLLVVEQSTRRALTLADRIYLLRSGKLVMSGTSPELSGNPAFETAYFGGGH